MAQRTLIGYRDVVRSFLIWRFGMSPADWPRVEVRDIWRYARNFGRGRKPATLNHDLRYRLRHTFATRLHARGADLKQIADLLGHRHLQTTTIYTKVDLNGLRALALPWPI